MIGGPPPGPWGPHGPAPGAPHNNPYAPPASPHGWPAQAYPAYPSPGPSTQAIVALVLAIGSWMTCWLVMSVPAIVLARAELKAIEAGQASPAGKAYAQAALWCAIGNVAVSLLLIGGYAIFFAIIFASAGAR